MTMPTSSVESPSRHPRHAGQSQLAPISSPRRALHLLTLSAFAFAQPIYDRAAERAGFLTDKGFNGSGIVALVLLLSFGIPLFLLALEWMAAQISPRSGPLLRIIVNDVLLTVILLPFIKQLGPIPGLVMFLLALMGGVATAWAYERLPITRRIVSFASAGAVLFPLWFLFFSSARGVLIPPPEARINPRNPVPVVVVVFDEFCGESLLDEDRRIDEARYPGFAELARHATWFRNATSVHSMTESAVPALLAGHYPQNRAGAPVLANYPQNLFSVIQNSKSYEMAVFEPVTRLCPEGYRADIPLSSGIRAQLQAVVPTLGLLFAYHVSPLEWHQHLPPIPRSWFGLVENFDVDRARRRGVFRYSWGNNRDEQFAHFLDCLSESKDPALYFSHLLVPHVPWCYLPSGKKYAAESQDWDLLNFDAHGEALGDWGDDELYILHNHARYLLQVGFADRLIGQLIERLKQSGLFDRCLLVVTADHGVSFRALDARRWLSENNVQDLMPVPLFIKRPHQEMGNISDRNVETIDVLPTIADVLGINLPLPVDGRSAFDESHPERSQKSMRDGELVVRRDAHPAETDSARMLQLKRFGSGKTRPNGLFETGPHPELIGRAVNDLVVERSQDTEIELTRAGAAIGEDSLGILPSLIEGVVHGKSADPVELAVSIDGTIQAVTRTYRLEGLRHTWSALIPESSVTGGDRRIEVFVISSSGQQLTLERPAMRNTARP